MGRPRLWIRQANLGGGLSASSSRSRTTAPGTSLPFRCEMAVPSMRSSPSTMRRSSCGRKTSPSATGYSARHSETEEVRRVRGFASNHGGVFAEMRWCEAEQCRCLFNQISARRASDSERPPVRYEAWPTPAAERREAGETDSRSSTARCGLTWGRRSAWGTGAVSSTGLGRSCPIVVQQRGRERERPPRHPRVVGPGTDDTRDTTHAGLVKAVGEQLLGSGWQRVHFTHRSRIRSTNSRERRHRR